MDLITVITPDSNTNHPSKTELEVAHILARYSRQPIELIPPRSGFKLKTPDLLMDGNAWEVKSTRSIKPNSLKDLFKRATKQSKYIVIDVREVKENHTRIITLVQRASNEYPSIQKLLCILGTNDVLVLKPLKEYNKKQERPGSPVSRGRRSIPKNY